MIARAWAWLRNLDEQRRRWHCRKWGHVIREVNAEPVLSFPVCRRCGKWGRQVVHGELVH